MARPALEASMRWFILTVALVSLPPAAALAEVVTVAKVISASADMSADGRTIMVSAGVDLPNGCWTNPRVVAPDPSVRPDAQGVVALSVVADSDAGPGQRCSMIYRTNAPATPLHWEAFPQPGLRAVKLVGSLTPLVVPVTEAGHADPD
jgi:hypothetical protein